PLLPRQPGREAGTELWVDVPHDRPRLVEGAKVGVVHEPPVAPRDPVAGRRPVVAPVVEQAHAVVVEEDERVVVDEHPPVAPTYVGLGDVPRGEPTALVAEDVHALEPLRPVIEVLLVAELPVLEAVVAPLDATVVPPVQGREPTLVPPEGEELDVVDPVHLLV